MTYIPFKKNYIQVELSSNSASVSDNGGNRCTFDLVTFKGDGHLSLSSGKVGLLTNRVYKVSASMRCSAGASVQVYDFTNGVGLCPLANIAETVDNDGHIECIVTPTGDIQVGVSSNNTSTYEVFTGPPIIGSYMLVREL